MNMFRFAIAVIYIWRIEITGGQYETGTQKKNEKTNGKKISGDFMYHSHFLYQHTDYDDTDAGKSLH